MRFFRTLMLISLVALWSCQEESDSLETVGGDTLPEVLSTIDLDKDQLLDDFALTVARSLDNAEFRALIKEEALKKYDGDYDIFYKFLENMSLNDDLIVKELLMDQIPLANAAQRSMSGEVWLGALKESYPELQLAVPVNIELWETAEYIPLVTFLRDDFDEATDLVLKAYDFKGNVYEISSVDEPEMPVIVVSRSERVDETGQMIEYPEEIIEVKDEKVAGKVADQGRTEAFPLAPTNLNILPTGSSGQYIISWNDVANEYKYQVMRMRPQDAGFQWIADLPANQNNLITYIGPGAKTFYIARGLGRNSSGGIDHGPWSTPISTFGSNRVDGERVRMSRMYMTGDKLKAVESWAAGAPEIFIRVAIGTANSAQVIYTSGKLEPGSRSDIKNKWWNKSFTMFNSWNVGTWGTVLTYNFIERDKSWSVKDLKISATYEDKKDESILKLGAEVTIEIDDSFKVIAQDVVLWWQDKDMIYEQDGFKWQLSN